ncbi:MAG: NAD-binding protein [Acidimicrobiia bacterium]|nr:NAD-binding protein [Acidimicrobiia bacterium]
MSRPPPTRSSKRTSSVGTRLVRFGLSWWQAVKWPLLGLATLVTFAFGVVGFREYFDGRNVDKSMLDLVYLSLQLFTLESGSVPEANPPWQLEVARLAAPTVSAVAVLAAVAVAFQDQLREWRLRRERGHVVVCGLGASGARLVAGLLEAGHRVVGIDVDEANRAATSLRRQGAVIVFGDARHRAVLERVRLDRAAYLISTIGADDTNADVVLGASEVVSRRQGPALVCLARVRDPDLCALLRAEELAAPSRPGSRLDFFNTDELGARLLLRAHPPFLSDQRGDDPNVMVVGLNRLGRSVVVELARQWRARPDADGNLVVTVLDPQAVTTLNRLRSHYPHLDHAAKLVVVETEIEPLDSGVLVGTSASVAYVCIDDDSASLQAAFAIHDRLNNPKPLVVAELDHARSLGRLIDGPGHVDRIRSFNVVDQTMAPSLLLGGTYEILARAIHDEYLANERRRGNTPATNPSMVPWEQLPEGLKESSRDQAAHIGTKLAAIGKAIAPLTDLDASDVVFTPDEVEVMAKMEHERFIEDRLRSGWTPGPKDIEAKTTPFLIPWDELSEDVKDKDREAVRGMPTFLSRAGYQIVSSPT